MIITRILKDWGLEALILSFFAVVIIPYGAGITFDTVSFFEAGDNFWSKGKYVHFDGKGGLEFAAHRFPLYPLIVSLFRHIDPCLLTLQIILFAALLAGFKYLLSDLKAPRYFLLLLATFPIFLNFYSIWTESLYGVLLVWLMIRLNREKDYQRSIWILIIVLLLCLTRMVGIVVAGSLLIAYLIDKRPQRGFLFFVVGAATIIAWTLLGSFYLGETARSIGYHGFNPQDLMSFLHEIGQWVTHIYGYDWISMIIGLAIFILPLFVGIRAWKNRHEQGVLFWFLIIHFYAYTLFVVLSKTFLDSSIAFGIRTFLPLMINLIGVLIMLQSGNVVNHRVRERIRYIFPKLFILIVGLNAFGIWNLRNTGLGYNSKEWQEYEFPEEISRIKASVVFTNDYAPIYLFGDNIHDAELLPMKKDLYSNEVFPEYEAEFDLMLMDLDKFKDYKIIWIRNGITHDVFPSYEELRDHPDLNVIYDDWLCLILEGK